MNHESQQTNGLPAGWVWTTIGVVAETTSGGTPSRKRPEYFGGDIAWVKSGELRDGVVVDVEETISEEGLTNSSAKVFPKDTALVALYGATVGRTAILGIDASTNQAVCAIFPRNGSFIPKYMTYWLRSQRDELVNLSAGGAQPNISQGILKAFSFPLAPLPEQHRIVAEIETQFTRLDAGVAALKRVQAKLRRYKAALLKAACEGRLVPTEAELARVEGRAYEPASALLERILAERRVQWQQANPGKRYVEPKGVNGDELAVLPEGWVWASWEQLSPRVTVGHVGKMKDEYVERGIPFLRSQNVRENRFDPVGLVFISEGFHRKLSKSTLRSGDLVVVRSGSVGVTCVIPDTFPEANCSDLVIIQRPLHVSPQYGNFFMNSLAKIRVRTGQVGVALIHFNTKSVAALPIAIPPISEQHRIVAEVERRLSVAQEVEGIVAAGLRRAERLRQSILKQAFAGRLTSRAGV